MTRILARMAGPVMIALVHLYAHVQLAMVESYVKTVSLVKV